MAQYLKPGGRNSWEQMRLHGCRFCSERCAALSGGAQTFVSVVRILKEEWVNYDENKTGAAVEKERGLLFKHHILKGKFVMRKKRLSSSKALNEECQNSWKVINIHRN